MPRVEEPFFYSEEHREKGSSSRVDQDSKGLRSYLEKKDLSQEEGFKVDPGGCL